MELLSSSPAFAQRHDFSNTPSNHISNGTGLALVLMTQNSPQEVRLLNLVIALLNANRPITRQEIRDSVTGYSLGQDEIAFARMLERDKAILRDLGVPINTVESKSAHSSELGYTIDRDEYSADNFELTASELGIVILAAQLWENTALESDSLRAVTKLKARASQADHSPLTGFHPTIAPDSPSLDPLLKAIGQRKPVSFEYRAPATGTVTARSVSPWKIAVRHSGWYVVGYDHEREAQRLFKLSRIVGKVGRAGKNVTYEDAHDIDLSALDSHSARKSHVAVIAIAQGRGHGLRARSVESSFAAPAGFDAREVQYFDPIEFSEDMAALAGSVVVLSPKDLRDEVVKRIAQVALITPASPASASERNDQEGHVE